MIDFETLLDVVPKIIFAICVIGFYIFFGGLKGHAETTLAMGVFLGFYLGREFYKEKA